MTSKSPTCPQCGSTNVVFHDGLLGYEAIRCFECDTETDLNSGETCPRGGKPCLDGEADRLTE